MWEFCPGRNLSLGSLHRISLGKVLTGFLSTMWMSTIIIRHEQKIADHLCRSAVDRNIAAVLLQGAGHVISAEPAPVPGLQILFGTPVPDIAAARPSGLFPNDELVFGITLDLPRLPNQFLIGRISPAQIQIQGCRIMKGHIQIGFMLCFDIFELSFPVECFEHFPQKRLTFSRGEGVFLLSCDG